MPIALTAQEVLNREFPEIRARLLQLGAALDRIDRGAGAAPDDPRAEKIREALRLLAEPDVRGSQGQPNRAERIQLLFSLPFDAQWKKTLAFPATTK